MPLTEPPSHAEQRQRLWALLGKLPERRGTPRVQVRAERATADYRLQELVLELNGLEPVPALLVRPATGDGPWPGVLYNHSHGGFYQVGKAELISGAPYLQPVPYAVDLARRGYAALCIDHWCFGERHREPETHTVLRMLHRGRVLWGMMLHDSLHALDWFAAQPWIDARRLGTIGISMGSTMAWWAAALDPRLAACVDICCLTDFHVFDQTSTMHAPGWYVPGILDRFTTAEVNALIAPRPHLSFAGLQDVYTPVAGLDRVDAELTRVYAALGVPGNWRLERYDVPHEETPQMRAHALDFLAQHLAPR